MLAFSCAVDRRPGILLFQCNQQRIFSTFRSMSFFETAYSLSSQLPTIKMMKTGFPIKNGNFFLWLSGVAIVLMGCGGTPKGDAGADETAVSATEEEAKPLSLSYDAVFDSAVNDKEVIVEGYLQLPNMMYTSDNSAHVDFYARTFQRFGTSITAYIQTGDCKNCMSIRIRSRRSAMAFSSAMRPFAATTTSSSAACSICCTTSVLIG